MMDEPRDLTQEALATAMRRRYEINVVAMEFLAVGEDAKASVYRVDTGHASTKYLLKRPRGVRSSRSTASPLAGSIAADPSTIELEFPAVTTPSVLNAGWSDASFSSEVPAWRLVHREEDSSARLDRHDLALEPALVDGSYHAPLRLR